MKQQGSKAVEQLTELSLFSGAGGGLLAGKLLGWRTVGYVEFNPYCQSVIAQRIKDGVLDEAPIFSDVRGLDTRKTNFCWSVYRARDCGTFKLFAASDRLAATGGGIRYLGGMPTSCPPPIAATGKIAPSALVAGSHRHGSTGAKSSCAPPNSRKSPLS